MPARHRPPAAPRAGTASPRRWLPEPGRCSLLLQTSGQQFILCLPLHHVSDVGMLLPSFGAPMGCVRGPAALAAPPAGEKSPEKLLRHHLEAGMLLGAKQGQTMGLCSRLPYLLPPRGLSPGVEAAHLKGNTRQAASVPSTKGHSDPGFVVAHTAQKTNLSRESGTRAHDGSPAAPTAPSPWSDWAACAEGLMK